MRSILALGLLFCLANAVELPDPVANLKSLDWGAPQRHADNLFELDARVKARDTSVSDECLVKYAEFILSPCLNYLQEAFTSNASEFNPIPFCDSNCSVAFNDLMTTCDQSWTLNNTASGFAMMTELICLKDGNTWCFTKFVALQNAFQGPPNTTTLDNLCGPCVEKVIDVIASYGDLGQDQVRAARLSLDVLCLKDGDTYCWVEFQEPEFQACFNNTSDSTVSCLDLLCSTCFAKVTTTLWLYYGANTTQGKLFATYRNFLCNMKGDQYCIILWAEATNNQTASGCPEVGDLVQSLGCCLGSVVNFLETLDPDVTKPIQQVFTTCHQTIPDACPRTGGTFYLAVHFTLDLPYDWADAHRDQIMQSIIDDIALFLGVSPDDVNITDLAPDSVSRTSSNTVVSLNLQGGSDSETQSYQTSLQSGDINFPTTQQTYATYYPHQEVGVSALSVTQLTVQQQSDTGTSASTTSGNSSASVAAVSALLTVAGAIVAM